MPLITSHTFSTVSESESESTESSSTYDFDSDSEEEYEGLVDVINVPLEFDQKHDLMLNEFRKKYKKVYVNVEKEIEKYNSYKDWKWKRLFIDLLEDIRNFDKSSLKPALPVSWSRYIWSFAGYSTWKAPEPISIIQD